MSEEGKPFPNGGNGLLHTSRTKSYGSLCRSPISPVRQRRIEHRIQPGQTLQGLALKYGVSMEQIKRANRMYTNDSIFLKKSLSIPVLSDCNSSVKSLFEDSEEDKAGSLSVAENSHAGQISESEWDYGSGTDLSPGEFLKRLDVQIKQSKQAAVRSCQDAEKRVAALEEACTSKTSAWQRLTRSQSVISSSKMQQHVAYEEVPLTITKCTKALREREDEIFQL